MKTDRLPMASHNPDATEEQSIHYVHAHVRENGTPPACVVAAMWSTPRTVSRRRLARGFTLVELLVVVAMVGVLAAIGMVGYRKYLNSAHGSEAIAVSQGIRAAQEAYRAETLTYLDCSPDLDTLHPRLVGALDDKQAHFLHPLGTSVEADCFRQLSVTTDGPVRFGYATVAGLPTDAPPAAAPAGFGQWPNFPAAPTEPWFVVVAKGDLDDDGVLAVYVSSSFSSKVYNENEGE